MKSTTSERLTDTLQLSHEDITNPTITYIAKVMNMISVWFATLKEVAGGGMPQELEDLQYIVELAAQKVPKNATAIEQRVTQHGMPPTRVQHTQTKITRSVSVVQVPALRVEPTPSRSTAVLQPPQRVQPPTTAT
jgi:hypothetical protein